MTPKEKAVELVDKFEEYSFMDINQRISSFETAKQCALIAVDLAIEYNDFHIEFLQEVKQEIEKI